ncbi:hypothetical protein [Rhodoblastus acidophilus]|nr:hypothetical protein [Rhodoblastus acidophilus]
MKARKFRAESRAEFTAKAAETAIAPSMSPGTFAIFALTNPLKVVATRR